MPKEENLLSDDWEPFDSQPWPEKDQLRTDREFEEFERANPGIVSGYDLDRHLDRPVSGR